MAEATTKELDWKALLDTALTSPGHISSQYNRFYRYSFLNQVLLLQQGVEPQPVATYSRWRAMGRQVKRGAKAREIIRPITVKSKTEVNADGSPKMYTKFKGVRCLFPVSDTEGEELPPYEAPGWDRTIALGALGVTEVEYAMFDGNTAGYSSGRELAINPVATSPMKTTMHELAHIVIGHTSPEQSAQYQTHRGVFEFEAEGTAFLVMNELGMLDEESASESRGYLQHWTASPTGNWAERSPDIRTMFKATDAILTAGRVVTSEVMEPAEVGL